MSACAWQGYGNNLLKYEDSETQAKGFKRSMSGIWLNIGCGKEHLSDFVNMDMARPYDKKLDARKGLPFADRTVEGIYSEHFVEHLTQEEGLGFLRECRRVLKPGRVV